MSQSKGRPIKEGGSLTARANRMKATHGPRCPAIHRTTAATARDIAKVAGKEVIPQSL